MLAMKRFATMRWIERRHPALLRETLDVARQFSDLAVGYHFAHLYRVVASRRPQTIMEFGAGISTVWLAGLLAAAGQGHLYSYEQSPVWHERLQSLLPARLRPFVTLTLAPLCYERMGAYRRIRYDIQPPTNVIDLAQVDGPTHPGNWPRAVRSPEYFAYMGDVMQLVEMGVRVRYALTDHRWVNFIPFRSTLKDTHRVWADATVRSVIVKEQRQPT